MSDATTIPILLDGDTGYGNFNNFQRLIQKLEQRGIAGVCIEDKIFPKTNSYINGEKQPLADIEEFCGKIRAGIDVKKDKDFVIVARVEALIAGWGVEEAIKRAKAYSKAGADAILIHSKISNFSEIKEFHRVWAECEERIPTIIVPTTYYTTPIEEFEKAGVSIVIWANQNMRTCVTAMQDTCRLLHGGHIVEVERSVCPVKDVFKIQDAKSYEEAEDRYLPKTKNSRAVILAATKGENFGSLVKEKPKCMIQISKTDTIISRIVKTFNELKIKDISVVLGYKHEAVSVPNIKKIINGTYNISSVFASLAQYCQENEFDDDDEVFVSYGDIIFESNVIELLKKAKGDFVFAVDIFVSNPTYPKDCILFEREIKHFEENREIAIKEVTTNTNEKSMYINKGSIGEFIGVMKISGNVMNRMKIAANEISKKNTFEDFFKDICLRSNPTAVVFTGMWHNINSIEDLTFLATPEK
jgi:phosphoenolpyruvate phosphomutase